MNNHLKDIKAYLVAQNVAVADSIYLNYEPDTYPQIVLRDIASSIDPDQSVATYNIAVTVSYDTKATSYSKALEVMRKLTNKAGKLTATGSPVVFLKIICRRTPEMIELTENGESIFYAEYQAIIKDKTLKTIYHTPS